MLAVAHTLYPNGVLVEVSELQDGDLRDRDRYFEGGRELPVMAALSATPRMSLDQLYREWQQRVAGRA